MPRSLLPTVRALLLAPLAALPAAACAGRGSVPEPLAVRPGTPELGPGEAPEGAPATPREQSATSRAGTYVVTWRPADGPVPLNEIFELDLRVSRAGDGSPVSGAEVFVDAAMPDHNHGMLREPRASEVEPGVYRVEGMLLHMEGYWQVFVSVIEGGVAETADFELTLE